MKSRLAFLLSAVLATACSGASSSSSSSSSGGQQAGLDAGSVGDAAVGDAATLLNTCMPQPVTGACSGQVVACSNNCSDACDVKLTLPAGTRFCSLLCSTAQDCASLATGLACNATDIGACTPACTQDSECAARGFTTCNQGACDTI